jgi:hypothetical protein
MKALTAPRSTFDAAIATTDNDAALDRRILCRKVYASIRLRAPGTLAFFLFHPTSHSPTSQPNSSTQSIRNSRSIAVSHPSSISQCRLPSSSSRSSAPSSPPPISPARSASAKITVVTRAAGANSPSNNWQLAPGKFRPRSISPCPASSKPTFRQRCTR